jgi:hypothetical protein
MLGSGQVTGSCEDGNKRLDFLNAVNLVTS